MPGFSSAKEVLITGIDAQVDALRIEVEARQERLGQLLDVRRALETLPLYENEREDSAAHSMQVRDDEFQHLTMAAAAAAVINRVGEPMHARDIWFAVVRGGYPHHSPTSFQALVTCMNRLKRRFQRVAPNTFWLHDAVLQNLNAAASGDAEHEEHCSVHSA